MKILFSILVLLISFAVTAKEEKNCDDFFEIIKNIPSSINQLKHYSYKPEIASRFAEELFESDTIGIVINNEGFVLNEKGIEIIDIAFASPLYFENISKGDYVKSINGIEMTKESIYNYSEKNK